MNNEKAALYAILARCFISEQDQVSLKVFENPELLEVFEKLSPGFQLYMTETIWDQQNLEDLASEYCRLFILPSKSCLSLQAGHWLTKESPLDLAQLENLIGQMSFDFDSRQFSSTPTDHLGLLLYFMSHLYSSPDPDIHDFAHQLSHMAFLWIPAFCAKLDDFTLNPFYLACCRLLEEVIRDELN